MNVQLFIARVKKERESVPITQSFTKKYQVSSTSNHQISKISLQVKNKQESFTYLWFNTGFRVKLEQNWSNYLNIQCKMQRTENPLRLVLYRKHYHDDKNVNNVNYPWKCSHFLFYQSCISMSNPFNDKRLIVCTNEKVIFI